MTHANLKLAHYPKPVFRHSLPAMKFRALTFVQFSACVLFSPAAQADVLVELFTSQACSVCEPSIELLSELENQDDVDTLSFHVDYWDYLGEDDRFANPLFGARQIGYLDDDQAKKEIHTPEIIISGVAGFSASEPEKIQESIEKALTQERDIIEISASETEVVVDLLPLKDVDQEYNVVLAALYTQDEVEALRNESTETLATSSLVKEIGALGFWDNNAKQSFAFQPEAGRSYVVFLQAPGFGEVIDSERVNIPPEK